MPEKEGKFIKMLKRVASAIAQDRAEAIVRKAEKAYRRKIEDLKDKLAEMKNQASESLDMSPDDTTSIIKVSDFKEAQFVQDDIERVISIGQLELDIKKLEERYAELFGT